MSAALLTALGRALGCSERGYPSPASRPLVSSRRAFHSETPAISVTRRAARAASGSPSLPESCYFSGSLAELGPPPAPRPSAHLGAGYLDREARELAERARADIIRFCQMRARIAARGRKVRRAAA